MTLLDPPVDLDARTVIRDDLDRNLFVEAGAGTGKTTVLVDRVVNLVAHGRVREPAGLVANTYTEAAAAELRDRIREQLERAAADPGRPAEARGRCREAVARIDEASITTLHGFAQRLLAAWPLEAGLPPAFEVDDEIAAGMRFAQRWRACCERLFCDPALAPYLETGFTLGLEVRGLREVAEELHRRWDRLVPADAGPPPPLLPLTPVTVATTIVAPVRRAAEIAGELVTDEADRLAAKLRSWLESVAAVERAGDEIELLEALVAADGPAGGGSGRSTRWGPRKAEVCALLDEAHGARRAVLAERRRSVIEAVLPTLARFTLDGVDERRRAGRLEFHDLLVHARDLLRRRPEVRAAAATAFDVVLIDEFQDTDPLQLEMAFLLAAADAADAADAPGAGAGTADEAAQGAGPWEEVALAPGKLVIVGDPTQSIYGFRGADIRLWARARARFAPHEVQRLRQNFRSVPSVLDWVNDVFDRLIGEGSAGTQPRFVNLHAARRSADEPASVVVVGGPAAEALVELRRREAADIAAVVATMKATHVEVVDGHDGSTAGRTRGGEAGRPLRYADIAVLVPTRAPLGALERALDRADIPYRIESRSLVWATDVVRELLAVLAAVDDPSDHVAVVAALRSPGFACSDDDLLRWRAGGGSWDYRRPPPSPSAVPGGAAGPPIDGPVAAAMTALASYHEQRWWLPVHQLVEQIVRERRLAELAFAQRRPRDHWRRLRFVIDAARAYVEAGGLALGDFVEWAVQQGDEGARAVETVVPEADDDAVRILTVHGSKGLEFPVVVLAGLNAAKRPDTTRVRWGPERPEVRAGTAAGGYFETAGYEALDGSARTADAEESVRLLYVAATRARDHLVLSLHHKPTTAQRGSHAEVLWWVCQGLDRGWRPAQLPEQLVLDVLDLDVAPVPDAGEVERAVAARAAWVADHDRALARSRAPRVRRASALSELVHGEPPPGEPPPGEPPMDPRAAPAGGPDDVSGPEAGQGWGLVAGLDDHADGAGPALRRDLGGTAVGRAVHRVLETVDFGAPGADDVVALARLQADAEGVPEAAGRVSALARAVLASPTVMAARSSARRWRELFVAAPVGTGLLEGYVDLLYEEPGGSLVVVDYKTDRARTDDELDRAVARHRLQGAAYALAIQVALGRPVSRCVFVFARAGGAVERTVADLPAAVAEVRALLSAPLA